MSLPIGPAVTFLFTDIEGSTKLERSVGATTWADVMARHDVLLRGAIESCGGTIVKTEGDAFFAAFESPGAAVSAAVRAQRQVAAEPWIGGIALRVRMGLHLGEGRLRKRAAASDPLDYVGIDVNYAARITAAANGGQIVLSDALVGSLPRDLGRIPDVADVELVAEGQRSVKDFEEPLPLYRLVIPGVADDHRVLRTSEVPTNLPGEVTSLFGRAEEIDSLGEELRNVRLVTLTGPGGSGKSRLALAVAWRVLDRHPHGAWLVDLAAVADPDLFESTIAATLGVPDSAELTISDALRRHLRDRHLLLVLDGIEQLLPRGAQTVARLLRDAPALRLLVTSRELLRVGGERGHPIPPLDIEAGVALFVDRARALLPDFAPTDAALASIRTICERLGGLPLALELAAARIRVLSPGLILERLGQSLDLASGARDVPERQRTLRGAVAWSFGLLDGPERLLFARLGIFADGWTMGSAASVVDMDGDLGIDLADGLESLVDKSLVQVKQGSPEVGYEAEARFVMHPVLRAFAIEQLDQGGERKIIESRFAGACVAFAEASGRDILGPRGELVMRRIDDEAHNLRAAIDWSLANDEPDTGLRIVGGVWRWFHQRGRHREARGVLGELLTHVDGRDPMARIAGLAAAGGLGYWMDDIGGAREAYEERLLLANRAGDDLLLADAHYDLGFLSMVAQDGAGLREHEQLALDRYMAAGREDQAIGARQALVLADFLAADFGSAERLERQNLDAFRRSGSATQVADSQTLLAAITWRLGDDGAAIELVSAAASAFLAADNASGLARALGMAAIVMLSGTDPDLGARLAGGAYRLVREKGLMLAPVTVLHLPDPGVLATERLGAERAAELLAEGGTWPLPELVERLATGAEHPRP